VSDYGNDTHIDDVDWFSGTEVADASTCAGAPIISLSSQTYGYGYFLADDQCNANGYQDTGDFGTLPRLPFEHGQRGRLRSHRTLTCRPAPRYPDL